MRRAKRHDPCRYDAVPPALQGRGVASQPLDHVLPLRFATGSYAVLTTHIPHNPVCYRRAGFETVWARRLRPKDGAPYVVWGMARHA